MPRLRHLRTRVGSAERRDSIRSLRSEGEVWAPTGGSFIEQMTAVFDQLPTRWSSWTRSWFMERFKRIWSCPGGVRQCESGGRKDSLWRCGCPGLFPPWFPPRTTFKFELHLNNSMNNRLNLRKPIIECALELELELEQAWHRSSSCSRCQVSACHHRNSKSFDKSRRCVPRKADEQCHER